MSSPVGFLWDSLSANTGDRAIGLHLLRWAERLGLPATAVDPALVPESDAAVLVIGGGELVHPPGHPFYDAFRVPGRHVLNAVGVLGDGEGDGEGGAVAAPHLADYRYVSVRSAADRAALATEAPEVAVVPCTTLAFADLARDGAGAAPPAGSIGLHVHAGSFAEEGPFAAAAAIRELLGPRVILFSFTPYNADLEVARAWAEIGGYGPPRVLTSPDEAYGFLARLEAAVVSSLHAAIFCYQAGVPFLVHGGQEKIARFTVPRGLEPRRFTSLEQLRDRRALLAPATADWDATLAADLGIVAAHLEALAGHLDDALRAPAAGRRAVRSPSTPVAAHLRSAHASMVALHAAHGRRVADALHDAAERQRARDHAAQLETQIAEHRRQQVEVAAYVRRLESELDAHRRHQVEVATYVAGIEAELRARRDAAR